MTAKLVQEKGNKFYFKNLDGLRAFAAILVLLFHSSAVLVERKQDTFYKPYFDRGGEFGVDLFFTLSGFLISFLLIKEIEVKGKIDIKAFLIRRVLRIWPLYFGVGIAGTILGPLILNYLNPQETALTLSKYWQNILYLITFTVNFQILFGQGNYGAIGTLWSICIEEQFYLLWPFLLLLFRKKILELIILIIAVGGIYYLLLPQYSYYCTIPRFYNFGIGAIGAYLYHVGEPTIFLTRAKFFFLKKEVQFILMLCFTLALFNIINIPYFNTISYSLVSLYLILVVISPLSIINLEYKYLKYLGKISYGMYMFHLFSIQISFKIMTMFYEKSDIGFYLLYPLLALVFTIFISTLSYELYEKYFLALKEKFSAPIHTNQPDFQKKHLLSKK